MSKNTVVSSCPQFIIRKSAIQNEFMRLEYRDRLILGWTTDKNFASPYASKYAAKQHLKILAENFKLPETIQIEQM